MKPCFYASLLDEALLDEALELAFPELPCKSGNSWMLANAHGRTMGSWASFKAHCSAQQARRA